MHKNLRRNQQGIATALMVVLVLVVLGAAGFVGYRVMNNKDGGSAASNSSLTSEEIEKIASQCDEVIGDDDFCQFATNFSGLETYSTVITTESDQGESSVSMKADGDNYQTTITSEGTVFADYISLDGVNYTKDVTTGEWSVSETSAVDLQDVKEDIKIDFEADKDEADRIKYNLIGKEACGSLTCFKYQIVDPASDDGDQFIFFDDDDYLLRKWTFTSDEAGTSEAAFSYDDVSITKPSPLAE